MEHCPLIDAFFQTRAFSYRPEQPFRLASGHTSPFYIDCRVLLGHPAPRHHVADMAWRLFNPIDFDCIGGIGMGAIPLAIAISTAAYDRADRALCRTFLVRKEPKAHGLGKRVEGAYQAGDRALVVDDVLTSGQSLLQAIEAARDVGLTVKQAFVLVDREEQDGRARIEAAGIQVQSLITAQQLIQAAMLRQRPAITPPTT